ncbi:peroxiredoxin [Sulfodiicoccus acidiphilus]|uniref:Peroxiredoxin n=1 Tax=Sulfodiicoccus acidiphilus TaxID=1670455 RepID=A0A348B450_9CREN|nr:peroxiredoxin [Sulfodiicoccus acidiphilus]BBD72952.1 peroxiredoxin [Sulfodiicoccus acidiphilus]GGT87768.1 peroxiredoxin [Sulfodiicoccus acidiphilus]
MVKVGDKAPDVQLVTTDFKTIKLSDFRGKVIVLAFYPGAFTSVCTKEMCTFRDNMAKFNEVDAVVIGVSTDTPPSNKKFKEENKLNYVVASDTTREAISKFGIVNENFLNLPGWTVAKRSVFVIDKDGVIRYAWVSDNPGVEPNYTEVEKVVKSLK